jgi:hypothetical protein
VRPATDAEIERAASDLDEAHEHEHGPDCDHDHDDSGDLVRVGRSMN